jgi:hypothetical protein
MILWAKRSYKSDLQRNPLCAGEMLSHAAAVATKRRSAQCIDYYVIARSYRSTSVDTLRLNETLVSKSS